MSSEIVESRGMNSKKKVLSLVLIDIAMAIIAII